MGKRRDIQFFLLALVCSGSVAAAEPENPTRMHMQLQSVKNVVGTELRAVEVSSTPFSITGVTLDGGDENGEQGVALGCFDHNVRVTRQNGSEVWRFDAGGVPCSLAAHDVDGDGRDELAVAALNETNTCYLLDDDGSVLWSYGEALPIVTVACGDVNEDGKAEIVAATRGGDVIILAGDTAEVIRRWQVEGSVTHVAVSRSKGGTHVLAAIPHRGVYAFRWENDEPAWRFSMNPAVPELCLNGSLEVTDVNGDDEDEIAIGGRPFCWAGLVGANGQKIWHNAFLFTGYATPWTVVRTHLGQFLPTKKDENAWQVAVVNNDGTVWLLDINGKPLYRGRCERDIFATGTVRHGSTDLLVCGFNRMKEVALVQFKCESARDDFAKLSLVPIGQQLDVLSAKVDAAKVAPGFRTHKASHIVMCMAQVAFDPVQRLSVTYELLRQYNSENLTAEFELHVYEDDIPGFPPPTATQGGTKQSPDELIDLARLCERERIPVYMQISHGCSPRLTHETATKVLDAAPNYLLGFTINEEIGHWPGEQFYRFFEDYLTGILDLCAERGKKLLAIEGGPFFSQVASDPRFFKALFRPEYRDVVVPFVKTNNPHGLAECMAGAVGLWRAGVVSDWGCATNTDNWRWDFYEYENACPSDILFRADMTAVSQGATYYRIEKLWEFAEPHFVGPRKGPGHPWREVSLLERSRRNRDMFLRMIGKGIVQPASRDDILGFSPVVIRHRLDRRFENTAGPFAWISSFFTRMNSGFFRLGMCLQTTSPDCAVAYLLNTRHYGEMPFNENPYGSLSIVPESVSPEALPGVTGEVVTDGNDLFIDGNEMSASAAQRSVETTFRDASSALLFTCDGAYVQTVRLQDGAYLVYLIDPGYFEPIGLRSRLVAGETVATGRELRAIDVLTGESIVLAGSPPSVEVTIPPGGFRLLNVGAELDGSARGTDQTMGSIRAAGHIVHRMDAEGAAHVH